MSDQAIGEGYITFMASTSAALKVLERERFDLTLIRTPLADGESIDGIPVIVASRNAGRIMFVCSNWNPSAMRILSKIHHVSAFDAAVGSPEELQAAILRVVNGRRHICPSLAARWRRMDWERVERLLTPTEQLVLSVIGTGCDNEEAAHRLRMPPATARTHRTRIMHKVGLHHRGELIAFAFRYGFVAMTSDGDLRPGLVFHGVEKRPAKIGARGVERPSCQ